MERRHRLAELEVELRLGHFGADKWHDLRDRVVGDRRRVQLELLNTRETASTIAAST
jgi:hypothetical protein